jgi:hypothetical protein
MQSEDNYIIKISPKGIVLSNGIDYCCVAIKSNDGTDFLAKAVGKDARELNEEATLMYTVANNRYKVAS